MDMTAEQAQEVLGCADKVAREFCVPTYIAYDYITVKASADRLTIFEHIDKINKSLEVKSHKNLDKYGAIYNKLSLQKELHWYWKWLVDEKWEEQAEDRYTTFKRYCNYLKEKENDEQQAIEKS